MFTPIISGLSFYDIAVYFVLFAILGYILEVIYAAVVLGKFVNRGFLGGPWCPIYGFGVLVVAMILKPISGSLLVTFIGSFIVTTLIEYLAGFILERIFNQKWWDYSDIPFNLNGYVCLKFSLIWAVGCTFVVKLVFPLIDWLTVIIPHIIGEIFCFTVIALMIADCVATLFAIAGMRKKLRLLNIIADRLRENTDDMGSFISKETLAVKERYDDLSKSFVSKWQQRRIFAAFPNLDKQRAELNIDHLREQLKEFVDKNEKRAAERQQKTIAKYETKIPEGAEVPFAHSLCFTKLFWLFMIGNVVGTTLETLWALLTLHKFEMRVGLVWGPFIPVYGFGAVVMTLLLYKSYKRRDLYIFTAAAIIGGAFEYLCSLFQELAFGTVSWEYSETTANFGGRTNLMYMLIWGILGLLWVKEFFPFISKQIEKIPKRLGTFLTIVMCVFITVDMVVSGAAVVRRGERREGIPADSSFELWLDKNFDDEKLDFLFPNMIYVE